MKRFRDAAREDYAYQYESNKQQYNYVPLRHPIDQLIKTRAKALLQSQSYTLSDAEIDILNLFSNEELLRNQASSVKQTVPEKQDNVIKEEQEETLALADYYNKSKIGFLPYIGVYGP